MITSEKTLPPMTGYNIPLMIALDWYAKHSKLNFWAEVQQYINQGYLLSAPAVFAMGQWIMIENEPAFFIRFAAGALEELPHYIPPKVKWIAFCRGNEGTIRRYSLQRLTALRHLGSLASPIFSHSMNGSEDK
jgi:hypothetical protein